MSLKEIAASVIAEDANREVSDSKVSISSNPDGSASYSVLVSFDPKVREEKAKAMEKGIKRDDLTDDLKDAEPEQADAGEPSQDEAPAVQGVFAFALDELNAQIAAETCDEKPKKHGLSPIENCRAKDPMYCPYHGQQAIKAALEKALVEAGIKLAKPGMTDVKHGVVVSVDPVGSGYKVTVHDNQGMHPVGDRAEKICHALSHLFDDKKGITAGLVDLPKDATTPGIDYSTQPTVSPDPDEKFLGLVDEWIDDLVTDIAADPSSMQDIDPQAVKDLLEARNSLEGLIDSNVYPSASAYQKTASDCRDKYLKARAQFDYRHIKSPLEAKEAEDAVASEMDKMQEEYHKLKAPVEAMKKALFGGPQFPKGFSKTHDWAAKFNKMSSALGFFIANDFAKAKESGLSLAPADLAGRRAAIAEMNYRKDSYESMLERFKAYLPEFIDAFDDYAVGEGIVEPDMYKAFHKEAESAKAFLKEISESPAEDE